jgi:acyl-CoA thioesterase
VLFSHVLDTVRASDDAWTAEVTEDWAQGRTLFGGIQAALAVRAMRDLVPQSVPLRVLQTSFIAPVAPGKLRIEASVLRSGKSVTHVEARILDQGQTACLVVGVFGKSRQSIIELTPARPQVPAAEDSELAPFREGVSPQFLRQVTMRWAHGVTIFKGAAEPKTQIYVGFRDEPYAGPGALGESQLIGYADIPPSPGFSLLKQRARGSSLTWTLELLTEDCGPARDGLWMVDCVVESGRDGYLNQSATLWSPDWQPVALSRQSVVVFG